MNRLLILILLSLTYYINTFAQKTTLAPSCPLIKFDSINPISSDTFGYLKKEYKIQIDKKYSPAYFPKITDNGVLFFVDNKEKALNFNVVSCELTLPVQGTFQTYYINGYYIRPENLGKITVGGKAKLSKIVYIDLSNTIYKNNIKEIEIIRLK